MSTDLQKYSTENQLHTIRRYSDEELLALLQAVLDEEGSLSGLIIDERDGNLINMVAVSAVSGAVLLGLLAVKHF